MLVTLLIVLAHAESPTPSPPPPVVTPAPAVTPEPPSVGVPECDAYISQMRACILKMDQQIQDIYMSTFDQTIAAWKAAAATPEGKAGLTAGCKAALTAMAEMPCGTKP